MFHGMILGPGAWVSVSLFKYWRSLFHLSSGASEESRISADREEARVCATIARTSRIPRISEIVQVSSRPGRRDRVAVGGAMGSAV